TTGATEAHGVRLCTPVPSSFTERNVPGTFSYKGMRCRDYRTLGRDSRRTITVHAVPAARGHLRLTARATLIDTPQIARDSAPADIAAGEACSAAVKRC